MSRQPVRVGLQTRLIASLAAVVCMLVLTMGWYWTRYVEKSLLDGLAQREDRTAALMARSLAVSLWNLDFLAAEELLDAVMADPEIHSVEITGVGSAQNSLRRSRVGNAVDPHRREFDIHYGSAARGRSVLVAQAVLTTTSELVLQRVKEARQFIASLLAAVLAAVVVSSYVLVNRLVKRPVSRLGELAEAVADGALGASAEVERADELGDLAQQFNAMSAQLRTSSERLKRSEERYRSLFENATEGIFQADSHGRLLDLNRALAQMLGFATPLQALADGRRTRQLVQLEGPEYKRIASALLRHRRLQQMPVLIVTRHGRQLWVELSAHLISSHSGEMRIEGMVSDISQRRLAEQELTRHRDHLEELVAERTAALSEAKHRAESANQSKSRFLATMSHEFRTPLNAILGFAQLLQMDEGLDARQQNKIKLIRDSGDHLLELITDVLDMASIEAGKVRLQASAVDLRSLLGSTCDAMRLRADQKALAFELQFDPELPSRVMIDGQRLRQVLLNLLSNAIKFTDAGSVRLQVDLIEQQLSAVRLRFCVSDTGIGMSAAQQEQLFKPFEQMADESRRQGGTGLGLSISQQLMRLMDSQIEVRSRLGRGSSFAFELTLTTLS